MSGVSNCVAVTEMIVLLHFGTLRVRVDNYARPLGRLTLLLAVRTAFVIVDTVLLASKVKKKKNYMFVCFYIILWTYWYCEVFQIASSLFLVYLECLFLLTDTWGQPPPRNRGLCLLLARSCQLADPNFGCRRSWDPRTAGDCLFAASSLFSLS